MKWRLPSGVPFRVPFRLRVFFRSAFALLALATVALALGVLLDEKQRALAGYAEGLKKNQAQIAARLRHPTGQLALLNPGAADGPALPPRALLLPFSAIDFDDRAKARQAVEMAGCALQYPNGATLCLAVGSNPYAGGFVYLVASFASGPWLAHKPGDRELDTAHRVALELRYRGQVVHWLAPFELAADGRGRLAGLEGAQEGSGLLPKGVRANKDFRGWVWQEGRCETDSACQLPTFVSLRLPVAAFQDALAARTPKWPPHDLDQLSVHVRALGPGNAPPLFDSLSPGAALPFSLADLRALLLPGETLTVQREGQAAPLLKLQGASDPPEPISPWLAQLIRRLPVEGFDSPVQARESITTSLGRHELLLTGDIRSVNQRLAAVATRLSWFVGAMLGAVLLTWLALEVRIIRRVTLLTRRAAVVSKNMRAGHQLDSLDLSDLRGSDELGVLAQGLKDLLQRVNEDVRREQIRTQQEKDMWHAVGHEIMSPLQSLMVLHGREGDPAERYITRMQQAVRVLYGQASPSEAFQTTTLSLQPLDLDAFLGHVAGNAGYIGIEQVAYSGPGAPLWVQADEYALEDVLGHVLRNAARHREAGTTITVVLQVEGDQARVRVHNRGPAIAPALLERIFEYGVSGESAASDASQRGQGLFVARTYMAKMGGTVNASNGDEGVCLTLSLTLGSGPGRPAQA